MLRCPLNICIGSVLFLMPNTAADPPKRGTELKDSNETVARVIFAEAASTTPIERYLVASVILNRVGHRGFSRGKLKDMESVVLEKVGRTKAFSCIGDPKNKQWDRSEDPSTLTHRERKVWNQAMLLSRGTFTPHPEVVAYHDNTIETPRSWTNNRYWKYERAIKTKSFSFYRVSPK